MKDKVIAKKIIVKFEEYCDYFWRKFA